MSYLLCAEETEHPEYCGQSAGLRNGVAEAGGEIGAKEGGDRGEDEDGTGSPRSFQ